MTACRIDAHQHYWQIARGDYGWLTPALALAAIHRDFGPQDLVPMLDRAGIAGTVLVQAAATDAETDYLLQIAASTGSRVLGVVGWTALCGAGALRRLEALAAHSLLKGVRPMLQDIDDPQWVLRADHAPAFHAIVEHGLAFDALVRTAHLPSVLVLAQRHPELRIVIDHGAKPAIRDDAFEPWASGIRDVATHTACLCKLSGLTTEAGPDWNVASLQRYVDHLLDVFGPSRLIWGSDWPVVILAADYDQWFRACESMLAALSDAERQAIFGGNAIEFYRLEPTQYR